MHAMRFWMAISRSLGVESTTLRVSCPLLEGQANSQRGVRGGITFSGYHSDNMHLHTGAAVPIYEANYYFRSGNGSSAKDLSSHNFLPVTRSPYRPWMPRTSGNGLTWRLWIEAQAANVQLGLAVQMTTMRMRRFGYNGRIGLRIEGAMDSYKS